MSPWWVRQRIEDGLLTGIVIKVGRRRIYRICSRDWAVFLGRYTGPSTDPRFDD